MCYIRSCIYLLLPVNCREKGKKPGTQTRPSTQNAAAHSPLYTHFSPPHTRCSLSIAHMATGVPLRIFALSVFSNSYVVKSFLRLSHLFDLNHVSHTIFPVSPDALLFDEDNIRREKFWKKEREILARYNCHNNRATIFNIALPFFKNMLLVGDTMSYQEKGDFR